MNFDALEDDNMELYTISMFTNEKGVRVGTSEGGFSPAFKSVLLVILIIIHFSFEIFAAIIVLSVVENIAAKVPAPPEAMMEEGIETLTRLSSMTHSRERAWRRVDDW